MKSAPKVIRFNTERNDQFHRHTGMYLNIANCNLMFFPKYFIEYRCIEHESLVTLRVTFKQNTRLKLTIEYLYSS